jgi:erythromycin esterase-like protein
MRIGLLVLLLLCACRKARDTAPAKVDDWITRNAVRVAGDSNESFDSAVDSIVAASDSLQVLGFGEPLHLGEGFLAARNRVFKRLVEAHGFSAIAIESGFPESRLVQQYVAGDSGSYDALVDRGFGWGFGHLAANRELVEWMRRYNADPAHPGKIRFYGFDLSSTGPGLVAGPARPLEAVIEYFGRVDPVAARAWKQRIDSLLSQLPDWEDRTKATGRLPAAAALRIATEDFIGEFRSRRPELATKSSDEEYLGALELALSARATLAWHAVAHRSLAGASGIRDVAMSDLISTFVGRERRRGSWRGRVLLFAHNGHLQRGALTLPYQGEQLTYWPLGSQLDEIFGRRYVVIGGAVGASDSTNGVRPAEPGSLEERLTALAGPQVFIPTFRGRRIDPTDLARLRPRSRSEKNPTYAPLGIQSLSDFDWLYVRDSTGLARQTGKSP